MPVTKRFAGMARSYKLQLRDFGDSGTVTGQTRNNPLPGRCLILSKSWTWADEKISGTKGQVIEYADGAHLRSHRALS